MLYSIENSDDSEGSNNLISLQDQVKGFRLQYKLDKQNFHEKLKDGLNLLLIQSEKLLTV